MSALTWVIKACFMQHMASKYTNNKFEIGIDFHCVPLTYIIHRKISTCTVMLNFMSPFPANINLKATLNGFLVPADYQWPYWYKITNMGILKVKNCCKLLIKYYTKQNICGYFFVIWNQLVKSICWICNKEFI